MNCNQNCNHTPSGRRRQPRRGGTRSVASSLTCPRGNPQAGYQRAVHTARCRPHSKHTTPPLPGHLRTSARNLASGRLAEPPTPPLHPSSAVPSVEAGASSTAHVRLYSPWEPMPRIWVGLVPAHANVSARRRVSTVADLAQALPAALANGTLKRMADRPPGIAHARRTGAKNTELAAYRSGGRSGVDRFCRRQRDSAGVRIRQHHPGCTRASARGAAAPGQPWRAGPGASRSQRGSVMRTQHMFSAGLSSAWASRRPAVSSMLSMRLPLISQISEA